MKQEQIVIRSLEQIQGMTNAVFAIYIDPDLLKKFDIGALSKPYVYFEVVQDNDKIIYIRMFARYGPFGQAVNKTEFRYYSTTYINYDNILSQLMHTLTWMGSPYYWYKTYFKKRMEVAG